MTSSPLSSARVLADIIEHYGEFYGAKLTEQRCEELALTRIGPELLRAEASLMQTKWFCYRRMHFVKATYLFANAYRDAFEQAWKRNFDRFELAKTGIRAWSGPDIFDLERSRIQGFVKARQAADRFGVPYNVFCRVAVQAVLDDAWTLKQSYKHNTIPRPEHLRSLHAIKTTVRTWELEECAAKLRFSPLDYYLTQHYVGATDQDAHQSWLIDQIKRRQTPSYALRHVVIDRPMLFPERAAEVWGEKLISNLGAVKTL